MSALIHFRLDGRAEDLDVGPACGSVVFTAGEIELTLSRDTADDETIIAVATLDREAADELAALFEARACAVAGGGSALEPTWSPAALDLTESDIDWLQPSEPLVAFCEQASDEMRAATFRLIQLLRWFFNRASPPSPSRPNA